MTRNDITGDRIASRPATKSFRENFDAIFKLQPTCCEVNAPDGYKQGRDCPVRCRDDGPDERKG